MHPRIFYVSIIINCFANQKLNIPSRVTENEIKIGTIIDTYLKNVHVLKVGGLGVHVLRDDVNNALRYLIATVCYVL